MRNKKEYLKLKPSVKVMLSYDYCHFEVALGSDQIMSLKEINKLRKRAQRLADEAVRQYKKAKEVASKLTQLDYDREALEKRAENIRRIPAKERTVQQKAQLKDFDDVVYWEQRGGYDYQDDEIAL